MKTVGNVCNTCSVDKPQLLLTPWSALSGFSHHVILKHVAVFCVFILSPRRFITQSIWQKLSLSLRWFIGLPFVESLLEPDLMLLQARLPSVSPCLTPCHSRDYFTDSLPWGFLYKPYFLCASPIRSCSTVCGTCDGITETEAGVELEELVSTCWFYVHIVGDRCCMHGVYAQQ